ncbi:MAG: acetate--CoA ligase family protein [Gammaproteobacteria bacterium]|nr:acetate--CoA ligase family protein [Gammaproteobacteria bacterium]
MGLQRFLNPRSIAFIGGAECAIAIERTRALGFEGRIWAVNPRRPRLGGIATIPSAGHVDGSPDAAFVALPRAATPEVLKALRALDCGGAVVYAAGFAESGERELQQSLLTAAAGMPLLGPNCYGFINAAARVALWPDEHGLAPLDSGVAVVTQSGNIACNLTMLQRGLPLALLLTLGNQADVDMAAAVEALAEDPRVTAIGMHIEGLRDIAAFARAAAVARERGKPLVALKTGRSPQGARIALSHTASLAGEDRLCDALFERYGIARVPTLTSLVETLKLLHFGGPMPGGRLLSLSCSGGEAALAADLALDLGLSFPPFPPAAAERVAATLNGLVNVDNPFDYHTFIWGQSEKLTRTFAAALGGGFDAAMLILDTPSHPAMEPDRWLLTARAFVAARRETATRAAVVASLPEGMPPDLARELGQAGVAPLIGIDDALRAFSAAAGIGAHDRRTPVALPWPPHRAGDGTAAAAMSEFEAKQVLRSFGVAVPDAVECALEEAPQAAERLGFPVAVKISSAAIAHKSDVGGVALSLRSPEEVTAATRRMVALGDRVLVERMAEGAVAELIVGVTRDPQFGMALVIGAGGVLAEMLSDTVTLLLPATRQDIERSLRRLRVWRLVEGFRGRRADGAAVVQAVEAVIALAAAHRDRLEELDVNPLLVLPDRAIAVDALVRMRPT